MDADRMAFRCCPLFRLVQRLPGTGRPCIRIKVRRERLEDLSSHSLFVLSLFCCFGRVAHPRSFRSLIHKFLGQPYNFLHAGQSTLRLKEE